MRIYRLTTFLIICLISTSSHAQQKWNLKTIVDYAMANNINVKLSDVQARIAAVNYNQNKFSQIPTLNVNLGGSLNSNTQSQISFARASGANFQATGSIQSSGDIFNFFSKRNAILASKWELEASKANVDKLKNDIALPRPQRLPNPYLLRPLRHAD